jgi:hypothetical protein
MKNRICTSLDAVSYRSLYQHSLHLDTPNSATVAASLARSSLPEPELEAITYNKCVVCRRIVVFIVSTLMRLHTQSEMESDATVSLWREQ